MKLIENQPGMVDASENILRKSKHPTRFGVLELSTRACKLLIADLRMLQEGFRWNAFQNKSQLSSTGLLLTEDKIIPWEGFEEHVVPIIKKHITTAKSLRVERLFCVATAALRQATNRDEILLNLQESLGLRVQLLDQSQEAMATIEGYIWKEKEKRTEKTQDFILIDQGGGSTEITSFSSSSRNINLHNTANISIGTASAIQVLQRDSGVLSIRETLWNILQKQCAIIHTTLSSMTLHPSCTVIGVGSAITRATNKMGNRKQHGTILSTGYLAKQKRRLEEAFVTEYKNTQAINAILADDSHPHAIKLQESLTSYFGLGMYIDILRIVGQKAVTVNGAGLRYGVCNQKINIRYPKFNEGELRQYLPKKHIQGFVF